jgi:hypothetical protein
MKSCLLLLLFGLVANGQLLLLSNKTLGLNNYYLGGLAIDENLNVYVTGGYSGTINFGAGNVTGSKYFVASYKPNGAYRWVRYTENTASIYSPGYALSSDGLLYWTGLELKYSPEGTVAINSAPCIVAFNETNGKLVYNQTASNTEVCFLVTEVLKKLAISSYLPLLSQ